MRKPLFLALVAFAAATLSCSIFVGGPELPDPPVVASADALASLQAAVANAVTASLVTGTLELQFSQEQLTAYLASKLAEQADPVLTDPQVTLNDQEMVVYGRARSGIFEANVALTTVVHLDDSGKPSIEITNAEIGPMPVPDSLRDALSATVDEAFTGSFGPVAIGFRLESIDISNGVMTVRGRIR